MDIIKYLNIGNHIWNLWLRIDRWWTKKTELQKSNIRKNFLIFVLILIIIALIVWNNLQNEKKDFQHRIEKNSLVKENNELKDKDNKKLEAENIEAKKMKSILDSLIIEHEVLKRTTK